MTFQILGLVVLSVASCGNQSAPTEAPRRTQNVLLLTIDTMRADYLNAVRGEVQLTPNLQALADHSVLFTAASSVAAETSPGVAGILTGLFPNRNGVIVNDHILHNAVPNLATVLSDSGFVCGAVVANPVIKPGYGFDHGFSSYTLVRPEHPFRKTKADAVNREALSWLENTDPDTRFFLWIHYMDPHGPYEPTQEALAPFSIEDFDAPRDLPLLEQDRHSGWQGIPAYQQKGRFSPTSDGRDYLLRYAAEIRYLDHHIGRLLSTMREMGTLEDTVVIIAADHGEAMVDDHGYYFSHNNGLTQDQIATPLMMSFPGCPTGTRRYPVSNVDIFPTICELTDIQPPNELAGRHLLDDTTHLVLSQSGTEKALRRGNLKLRYIKEENSFIVYDLSEDPGETTDMSNNLTEPLAVLRQLLEQTTSKPPIQRPTNRQLIDEEISALKALGYVVGDDQTPGRP